MAARKPPTGSSSTAAGLSGGTGFAGLVLLMPDGVLRSALLILSPSITIVITSFWQVAIDELSTWLADWKLHRQTKSAE